MPRPFGQIVTDVNKPLAIENMAAWFECLRHLGPLSEAKQSGERKPHPAPLIGNRGPTLIAADFAGQYAVIHALFAIEIIQLIQTGSEPHVMFVKDGSPLHGGAMQCLASFAVTEFRIHRLSAHLVANAAAKTRSLVFWHKCRIIKGCIFGSESVFGREHHKSFQRGPANF